MKVVIWRSMYVGLREKSYICILEVVVIECILVSLGIFVTIRCKRKVFLCNYKIQYGILRL